MPPPTRSRRRWPFLRGWLRAPALTHAQTIGSIFGNVSDANTGALLAGAKVTVTGSALEAYTAADGTFTLTPVPAGTHEVVVGYLGSENNRESVTLAAGPRAVCNVTRGGEVVLTAAFTAEGAAGAQARAMNFQRAAGKPAAERTRLAVARTAPSSGLPQQERAAAVVARHPGLAHHGTL